MTGKVHNPDRRTRELVSALALNGVAQSRVAEHVGISEPSLRKHYRRELDLATESVCARVAKNLVRIACTGSGNATVQAAKYVLGCKAGWKDTTHIEVEPSGGEGLSGLMRQCGIESSNVRERIIAKIEALRVDPREPDAEHCSAYKSPAGEEGEDQARK